MTGPANAADRTQRRPGDAERIQKIDVGQDSRANQLARRSLPQRSNICAAGTIRIASAAMGSGSFSISLSSSSTAAAVPPVS